MKTIKKLEKFEASKLEKSQFRVIKGGFCTCGTVSICHIDGTDDGD